MPEYFSVYLSLGSNMGSRRENCLAAIDRLKSLEEVKLLAKSPFYLTEPVDYLEQQWFVNAAVKIETCLSPVKLLRTTQSIQKICGRTPGSIRFGPRIIDLDIIFFGDFIIDLPELTVPHPRMHKRRFVLQPICDIDPTVIHPLLGESVRKLLARLNPDGQRMVPCC